MKKDGVLEAFSAATRATLKNVIAPLMVWRDVFSKEAALKFDLLTARLSIATLAKSSDAAGPARPGHRPRLAPAHQPPTGSGKTARHPEGQAEVHLRRRDHRRPRFPPHRVARHHALSGQSHRRSGRAPLHRPEGRIGQYKFTPHHVKLAGLDLAAYRSRVESVLHDLFDQSAALKNIRAGLPSPRRISTNSSKTSCSTIRTSTSKNSSTTIRTSPRTSPSPSAGSSAWMRKRSTTTSSPSSSNSPRSIPTRSDSWNS